MKPDFTSFVFKKLILIIFIPFLSFYALGQMAVGDGECPFVGNIVSNNVPGNFNTYWNQVTPENAGKWGSVESTRDVMNWTALDLAYEHAKDNNYPFKQHTFIWNNQKPAWIDGLTQAEQLEEIEEWIKLYSERYPETAFIDVVNEPLHAVPTFKDALGGNGMTGYDWIIWSFEKAREYNPNAKLLLNDYNILNNTSKTNTYFNIIEILQERELIDGIGLQGHFLETTDNSVIKANLDKLASTGLPVYISEYDVNLNNDQQQLEVMKSQFPVLYQHDAVEGITLWGYQQGKIWRTDAYLIRSNGTERPSLVWLKDYLAARCSGVLSAGNGHPDYGLKIYPNPVTDGTINLNLSGSASSIQVSDINGRIVFKEKYNTPLSRMNINLSLAPGMYVLQINGEENSHTEKIIIK